MNKSALRIFFVVLLINSHPLLAEMKSALEIRSSAFFSSSKHFRKRYGRVSASYQLEASTKIYNFWDGWVNFDWCSKSGRSEGFEDSTTIRMGSLSLGVRIPYQLDKCFIAYMGIGPSLSRIWIKNQSQCNHKTVIGGVLKTGIYYFMSREIFIDLFVDYFYQPVHVETRVKGGGIKTGLGIGVRF